MGEGGVKSLILTNLSYVSCRVYKVQQFVKIKDLTPRLSEPFRIPVVNRSSSVSVLV